MLLGVLDCSVKSEGEVDRQPVLGNIWGGCKFDSGPDFHPREFPPVHPVYQGLTRMGSFVPF